MSICKSVAKKPHLADDLYQEFFLSLLEIKDERLIEAEAGQYLDLFCVGIIRNIWGKRYNVKRYDKGKTSPLFEARAYSMSEVSTTINNDDNHDIEHWVTDQYLLVEEIHYDTNRDENETELQGFIQRFLESEDVNERFRSRVFYYSNFKFKNVRQFSKASGIPYQVCIFAYRAFKQKIKEEVCIKKS